MSVQTSNTVPLDLDVDLSQHLDELTLDETDDEDEPVLRWKDGRLVDTWREGYPYDERMPRPDYEVVKRLLQIELLKLQNWVKDNGQAHRHPVRGPGRRGQGGHHQAVHRAPEPPWVDRGRARKAERTRAGRVVLPALRRAPARRRRDRAVRPVLVQPGRRRAGHGLTAPTSEYQLFVQQAPEFERLLTDDGIAVIKFWFSVSRSEQRTRFLIRRIDPVRQWKLSPTDLASLDRWDDYTAAKEAMFKLTDTTWAPWTVIKSNDKKRARIGAMRYVLSLFDYPNQDPGIVGTPDPLIVGPASEVYEHGETPGGPGQAAS